MIKFLKALVINFFICLTVGSTVWVLTGLVIGIVCIYSPTIDAFFRLTSKSKFFVDNRDLISFAVEGIQIYLIMNFPYALAVTIGLEGKIAYTQTLAKSQRGRDFIERLKSLDAALSAALRKLLERRSEEDL